MPTLQDKDIREKIRAGEPITKCGLTFYPITMQFYEDFIGCKDVLELRLSSLPARYASKDFFTAIFLMDSNAARENPEKSTGTFLRFIHLFFLSLRTSIEEANLEENVFYAKNGDETVIDHIRVKQGDQTVEITPYEFSAVIRPLIAEINGVKLPDESENIDLVRAAQEKKEFESGLRNETFDIDNLISSVAYQSGRRIKDLLDWTVREFELLKNAIDRDKRFMLYGQAEMSGMVTFKKGNPAPSWCFDCIDDSLGTRSLSEMAIGGITEGGTLPQK